MTGFEAHESLVSLCIVSSSLTKCCILQLSKKRN